VLTRVADTAKLADVFRDPIQMEAVQPPEASIATAGDRGCDLIVMASCRDPRRARGRAAGRPDNRDVCRTFRRSDECTVARRCPEMG